MSSAEDVQQAVVHVIDDDSVLHQVEVELMEIGSSCEVEISNRDEEVITSDMISAEDQQLLNEEIEEEALEDADVSQDISQQGKRLLLKDWLIQKLDNEEMPDILSWYNKPDGLFRIKWLHKATDSWEVMADGVLFKEWCIHTGKYDPNNENPRKWKANFRCALNSLPDVIIVPSLCVRKGKDAYRVFKILPEKIPEKVREKQESSRKRRREKRETLLKAYAKNQADLGNLEHAEAITRQIAMNPSNIKIHLKRNILSHVFAPVTAKKPVPLSKPCTLKPKPASSPATRSSTSGAKTVLNGMDALCTAAAMMADTPGEEKVKAENEEESNSEPTEVVVVPITTTPSLIAKSKVITSAGDVVTYYRPVGSIPSATSKERSMISPSKPIVSVGSQIPMVPASAITSLPLFKPVESGKLGTAAITTSTGNVLLSVRLAQPATSSTTPTIVQQGVPISQIQGLPPGVCLQPFSPSTLSPQSPSPAYLIPKTFIQQQIAASAGNQPARVYTVKPSKVSDPTPSTAAEYARTKRLHAKVKLAQSPDTTSTKLSIDKYGQIKIAPHFDLKDYNQFKLSIFKMMELEGICLPFQLCKHTPLVRAIRLYDSDKPNVEVSVTVATDYTFSVVVHNRTLPPVHELLKRHSSKTIKNWIQLKVFLERLSEYVTCIGNPEEMAHRQYTDYSSFVAAYQEPDLGAKNPILRYHSTIRSNSCTLLIKAPPDVSSLSEDEAKECYRCDDCARIRIHVLSMRGLFSLLDGAKVPDIESARRKRLQHLKDYTTKDVLANRVDVLETQIKRYQQLLPTELQNIEPVMSVTVLDSPSASVSSDKLVETVTQSVESLEDGTSGSHYVTSISESVNCTGNGEVQNVIRVTLSHPDGTASSDLSDETVYHIVDNSSHSSDIMLVTDDDNLLNEQTTERLLQEFTNSALSNT